MMRALAVLLAACVALVAVHARAQAAPDIRVDLDAPVIAVGDVVHLQMSATSQGGMPDEPRLPPTPGLTARAQNASRARIGVNGVDHYTLTVDWALQADRTGTFVIGPPSVVVGGTRYPGRRVSVRVVPAGQGPPRQRPQPMTPSMPFGGISPFDPWRGLFPDFGNLQDLGAPPEPAVDPKLSLDAPRGQGIFLHATIDKTSAAVGEQVTYTAYQYTDVTARWAPDDPHDPEANDFIKRPISRDDADSPPVGFASVGGRVWRVDIIHRWALFPLHAGDLEIGPMAVRVTPAQGGAPSTRTSETLHVHVTEPPVASRPPGYELGDVGRFSLTAQVQPRQATEGGVVGVHVELSGTGNLPSELPTPARADLDWLTPEVHDKLGPIGQDGYGGTRTFDYVVRFKRPGAIDLGELRLPFWDAEKKRYEVARAPLGVVQVTPSASAAGADSTPELLPGLPPPRDHLEGVVTARRHLDDSPLFWLAGVGGGPLALGFAFVGRAAGRRAVGAWRRRKGSPLAELRERMAAARVACGRDDARIIDAAVARTLEAAALAHAGARVRGAVGEADATQRLRGAGVPIDVAGQVAALLHRCEQARFSPDAVDVAEARGRWSEAQSLIRRLEKRA